MARDARQLPLSTLHTFCTNAPTDGERYCDFRAGAGIYVDPRVNEATDDFDNLGDKISSIRFVGTCGPIG